MSNAKSNPPISATEAVWEPTIVSVEMLGIKIIAHLISPPPLVKRRLVVCEEHQLKTRMDLRCCPKHGSSYFPAYTDFCSFVGKKSGKCGRRLYELHHSQTGGCARSYTTPIKAAPPLESKIYGRWDIYDVHSMNEWLGDFYNISMQKIGVQIMPRSAHDFRMRVVPQLNVSQLPRGIRQSISRMVDLVFLKAGQSPLVDSLRRIILHDILPTECNEQSDFWLEIFADRSFRIRHDCGAEMQSSSSLWQSHAQLVARLQSLLTEDLNKHVVAAIILCQAANPTSTHTEDAIKYLHNLAKSESGSSWLEIPNNLVECA